MLLGSVSLSSSDQSSFWLGPQASVAAKYHDWVFDVLFYATSFFFILVVGLMLYFVAVYRRKPGPLPVGGPTHNTPLEIFWTAVPLVIVCWFFVVGLYGYVDFEGPAPANSDVVEVEAKQWNFTFTYPNGAVSPDLYVQVDRPTSLQLHSQDVSHSVYIPAFRVQRNAVPGRITYLWFTPSVLGSYDLFCTQYCGDGHSAMNAKCEVLDAPAYSAKLAELANIFVDPLTKEPLPYAKVGERLYKTSGCAQCHSVDGAAGTGPTWKGLYKSDVPFAVAPPGYKLTAEDDDAKWDAYLRESILVPSAKIVDKFQNVMPAQESQFSGSPYKDKKLTAIVEYIKSLDTSGPPPRYYKPMPIPKEEKKPEAPMSVPPKDSAKTGDAAPPKTT
jgi:cytochrome c oxidase subunit 2